LGKDDRSRRANENVSSVDVREATAADAEAISDLLTELGYPASACVTDSMFSLERFGSS
jgi:hypothetical protein